MRFHRHLTQMDRGSQLRRIDRSVDAFHHCDIYVISFSEGSIYRRGARRWRKLYRVNGHIFQAKRFNRVSIIPFNYHCATCTLFISPWSLPLALLSFICNFCESRSVAGAMRPAKPTFCAEHFQLKLAG